MGNILNIPWFMLRMCAQGIYALCLAGVIIVVAMMCMAVWLLIPAYLIMELEHYTIGIIYTLLVWGIAFKLIEN